MNYYVAIVNKDSPSVVKNLMKLMTRGGKDHLMDAIYEVAAAAA